jgi:hypothetical protein
VYLPSNGRGPDFRPGRVRLIALGTPMVRSSQGLYLSKQRVP